MIRVLVVDDDFMVARVHRGYVESVPGFEVVGVAHTGKAAVEATDEHSPDLLLLDIYLPDVDGLTLLRTLREEHEHLDAIVISAAREAPIVRKALRGGIVHYLLKPFSRDALRDCLLHYLDSYGRLDTERQAEQHDLDRVFRHPTTPVSLPKKLSEETAVLVERALRSAAGDMSASECAETLGLSRVSVRRYLEYFVTSGRVAVRLKYGEVGRPERRYAWIASPAPG